MLMFPVCLCLCIFLLFFYEQMQSLQIMPCFCK